MTRARLVTAARVAVIVLLATGAAVGGYAVTSSVRSTKPHPTASPPAALRRATTAPSGFAAPSAPPEPSAAAVRHALTSAVTSPALGQLLRARVVDDATGATLYDRNGARPGAPASTAKLLTAAALLSDRAVTDRIETRVVAGSGAAVVLVGGGDPTLSGARPKQPTTYAGAARITDLAAQLRRAHEQPSAIVVDDSLFTGPAVSPAWAPEDVPSSYASAITAVMADGGRPTPASDVRSSAPDIAAGHELAAALGTPRLPVMRGRAPSGAKLLASVQSAPFGELVEEALQTSDNVIAECLARQVAIAERQPVSFLGAAHAIRTALTRLGLDPGAGMVDGSGLAARDRVSAATLAGVVRLISSAQHPQLHAIVSALPVAGWSGTLVDRYLIGSQRVGAGVVRAKTGSLTGVSTLAGVVHDRSGRLLAFAVMADDIASVDAADTALDEIAARLAGL